MPNHDRFECQTAIDSDAILQSVCILLRRLLAGVCGDTDNSITLCQLQDKENDGSRCVMAIGHQTDYISG